MTHNNRGGRHVMPNAPSDREGNSHIESEGGGMKTSAAKLRGNRVHVRFNRLCAEWIKRNQPRVAARLRKQAKKEEHNVSD